MMYVDINLVYFPLTDTRHAAMNVHGGKKFIVTSHCLRFETEAIIKIV